MFDHFRQSKIEELTVSCKAELLNSLATSIAMGILRDPENGVEVEIKKQIAQQIRAEMREIKKEILEEVIDAFKKSDTLKAQEAFKKTVKREVKEEVAPLVESWVVNKIAKTVESDIRAAAKRSFSQELLAEFKDEMVTYFLGDLKKSLRGITTEIKPVVIEKSCEEIKADCVPAELSQMGNVFRYNTKIGKMASASGIYFLYNKKELQYIGQAVYVTERIPHHFKDKIFDEAYFIPVRMEHLDHVETYLITLYKPALNKSAGVIKHRNLDNIPNFIFENLSTALQA